MGKGGSEVEETGYRTSVITLRGNGTNSALRDVINQIKLMLARLDNDAIFYVPETIDIDALVEAVEGDPDLKLIKFDCDRREITVLPCLSSRESDIDAED